MNLALTIPDILAEKVASYAESSYGATRVILILADGRRIRDVFLAWNSEIAKIGNRLITKSYELDFLIHDITDVERQ